MRSAAAMFALAALAIATRVAPPSVSPHVDLTVATYNTWHGLDPARQAAILAVQDPEPAIISAQEAQITQLDDYVTVIEQTMGGDWTGHAAQHCVTGTPPRCDGYGVESVMVFSRYPIDQVEPRLL